MMEAQSAENADVRAVGERGQVIKGAIQDAVMWAHGRCINDAEFAAVNAEYGPAFDALDALVAETSRLRDALDTIAADGTAPVWIRDFARYASTTGSGAQAAPPEKP